jgi:Protein of unknown function (DUF1571)
MIKAKDCVGPLSPWMVTFLGLSLCFLELGCSGMGGLRSIAIDPASFLRFRDRSGPGSPAPENDLYAKAMRAPREGSTGSAKQAGNLSAQRDGKPAPADPDERSVDETDGPPSTRRSSTSNQPDGDGTIRVSLGRPEPLPGLVRAEAPPENLASTTGSTPWRAEKTKRDLHTFPGLTSPADRDEPARGSHSRLAEQSRPYAATDPKVLLARAEVKLDALKTYQVKISRQERVEGRLQPEEDILLSIRCDPKAVRLEWSSGPNKGREVIYSSTLDPGMIFVHQPSTAIVLPSMKIPVDSPLVTRISRHSITEAGFDTILENMHGSKGAADQNQPERGELVYKGLETPRGLDGPCHHFVRRSVAGETWNVYLDLRSMLPRLVVAEDSGGDLIERYVYHEIRENPPDLALAGAFEPDQRWGDSKGLFSRLARAAVGSNLPTTTNTTTR